MQKHSKHDQCAGMGRVYAFAKLAHGTMEDDLNCRANHPLESTGGFNELR
jgi:hypothetical protein